MIITCLAWIRVTLKILSCFETPEIQEPNSKIQKNLAMVSLYSWR
jgi:hypothetical protein